MSKPSALSNALRNAAAGKSAAAPASKSAPPSSDEAGEAVPKAARATKQAKAAVRASREGMSGITVSYPEPVRRQLKMMGAEMDRNMDDLVAEALNLLFAKHRKPEIAPRKGGKID